LIIIQDLSVVLAGNFLVVLYNVPLFFVQFDEFFVRSKLLGLSGGARFLPGVVLPESTASAASISSATTASTELATATVVASKAGLFAVKFIGG